MPSARKRWPNGYSSKRTMQQADSSNYRGNRCGSWTWLRNGRRAKPTASHRHRNHRSTGVRSPSKGCACFQPLRWRSPGASPNLQAFAALAGPAGPAVPAASAGPAGPAAPAVPAAPATPVAPAAPADPALSSVEEPTIVLTKERLLAFAAQNALGVVGNSETLAALIQGDRLHLTLGGIDPPVHGAYHIRKSTLIQLAADGILTLFGDSDGLRRLVESGRFEEFLRTEQGETQGTQ